MHAFIRFGLLLAALLVCIAIIAAHGVRGVVIVIVIMLIATVPQTRLWKVGERYLVRLTGSRRRAAVAIFALIIAIMVAINIYQLVYR